MPAAESPESRPTVPVPAERARKRFDSRHPDALHHVSEALERLISSRVPPLPKLPVVP